VPVRLGQRGLEQILGELVVAGDQVRGPGQGRGTVRTTKSWKSSTTAMLTPSP
jgi:hypothetical protein